MENHNLFKRAAEEKDIKFIKAWIDDYGNILSVIQTEGKKFGMIRMESDWFYFLGIGSAEKTKEMPAGRGDYFIAQKIAPNDSAVLSSALKNSGLPLLKLNNKNGAAWAPRDESQQRALAKLVDDSAVVNDFLSSSGILYSGGDRVIFGEDVTGEDIMKWKIPMKVIPPQRYNSSSDQPSKGQTAKDYKLPADQEQMWRDMFYDTAASQIGTPYYWGGDDPGKGFDCSGLVHWSLDKSGLIPGAPDDVAAGQMNLGTPIGEGDLKKGDLIGFRTAKGVPHIGIYTGQGTSYLSASGGGRNTHGDNPKAKVQIGDYTRYGAPAFFSSIAPLIQKRISSKNIA